MACNLTSGISKGCKDNAGGIVEVYLGNYPTGYTAVEWFAETGGTITAISGVSLYTFQVNKNSSDYTQNIMSTVENGTIGYEQLINMVFAKNDVDKRNAVKVMGQANLIAIVRDKNESYWMFGAQNGLELTAGSSTSGKLLNDLNGWTITMGGQEPQPAYAVSSSIIAALTV